MNAIRQRALKLLARREYSRYELQRKLMQKEEDLPAVTQVLDELAKNQLQDDARFELALIHSRAHAGYGPRRILAELRERGIHEVPRSLADENSTEWQVVLEKVWRKKFKQPPQDFKNQAKQTCFLIYRGFAPEQVHRFLKTILERDYEQND